MSATLDVDVLWRGTLPELINSTPTEAQRQWLKATHPVGYSDDTVILATPNDFVRQWLDEHCSQTIRETLSRQAGRPIGVMIMVGSGTPGRPTPEPDLGTPESRLGAPRTDAAGPELAPMDAPAHVMDAPRADREPRRSDGEYARQGEQGPWTEAAGATPANLGDAIGDPAAATRPTTGPATSSTGRPSRDEHDTSGYDPGGFDPDAGYDHPAGDHGDDGRPRVPFEPSSQRPLDAPGRPPGESVVLPERRQPSTEVEPDTQLNPKYLFDSFVIGASNRFAHAAAFAVAETPAKAYNPLFIYGESGLGKTHLLHAVGHYVRHLYPRLRVRYVTTEQFTNEFITAVKDARMAHFQRLYRKVDILLIDDIQFLSERERTQEEFFHTFNALHNAEKQIVISSDRPPRQIARLEDRLRSRFEWGLMTDVQPPDLETRIAILRRKSATERLDISADVLEFIASRVQSNIRELEGALIRVAAFASLQGKAPDGEMAERVLKDLFPEDAKRDISVHLIQDEVAAFFDYTVEEMKSKNRTRKLSRARQIAMYLTREMTDMSLPKIGDAFGGRDHSTVLHANNKIADLMGEERVIYDQVMELTNAIKTRARQT